MKQVPWLMVAALAMGACSQKDQRKEEGGAFFPVRSYLQSQIKHIDTSLYPLRKVVKTQAGTDTAFIPRERFRAEANDFLEIPDIAGKKWRDDYTESRIYDEALKRAIFSYTPKEEDAPILRQDVTIEPGASGEDAVRTIFINQLNDKRDSSVQKKMLWEVGRRFQVVTTVSRQGKPDELRTLEVWWGPFPSAE